MIICSILNKKLRFKDSIEVYVVMILCLSLGCALILPYPSEKSTIFPLLIVILPTLFTEKFHNMVIFLISALTLFLGLILFHQDKSIWFWEIYNGIVLTLISIVVHWMISRERCVGYLSMSVNQEMIVKLEKTQKELKYLSENDILSGLRNRRKLFNTMNKIQKKEIEFPKGAIMLDIDDFKKYNDSYGHAAGDACIQALGTMLLTFEQRNKIKFYRYGGEEFIGLFWCDDKNELTELANEISKEACNLELSLSSISVSIGISLCDSKNLNYEYWIALADKALYTAKAKGKNCICCWNDL